MAKGNEFMEDSIDTFSITFTANGEPEEVT